MTICAGSEETDSCEVRFFRTIYWQSTFMEQKLRFGLVLGQLAVVNKKIGPIESNF